MALAADGKVEYIEDGVVKELEPGDCIEVRSERAQWLGIYDGEDQDLTEWEYGDGSHDTTTVRDFERGMEEGKVTVL